MRRALVFGENFFSQALSRRTILSPLTLRLSSSRHYASYTFNNHLSHTDNGHFPELSLKDFVEEMKRPENQRLLYDAVATPSWSIRIENIKDLKPALDTAYQKCECFKQEYYTGEPDFDMDIKQIFDALRVFRDIFEYSTSHPTSTAQNIKKVALEYLDTFQKELKKLINSEDQKRESYLAIERAIQEFLQKEMPQDSPSP